ncbi:MAG TPA: ferritin-like protein, partial [Thermoanaerobaculia bacterium]|nr:ferritin-like protein [Thermoanaerobaculia bacterium]
MSYLDVPRLVFAGKFQADPSTINNDPEHFDSEDFRSNYQVSGPGATNGWWNPRGTGAWRLFDCTVQSVAYEDGTWCDDPLIDPVVGLSVTGADARVEAKLVDLDPEQQMVSEVWGLQVLVQSAAAGVVLRGSFVESPFADIWTRFPAGQPDSFFGAYYQSILAGVQWQSLKGSRFLKEIGDPGKLSLKFNVDGYQDDSTSPWFTFGRIVGALGRATPGQPKRFVPGRRLNPAGGSVTNAAGQPAAVQNAMGWLDGNRLTVDLGNSLPTASAGGPLQDLGILHIGLLPASGTPVALGEVDYRCPGWYERRAGLVAFELTGKQAKAAANAPLLLLQSTANGLVTLLEENANGQWVRADQFVFRLDSHASATTRLWATEFGRPLPGQPVALAFDNTYVEQQVLQGPVAGPPVGVPASGLRFEAPGVTDADGTITVTLTGNLDSNPRQYIDGQVYGVTYGLGTVPPAPGSRGLSDILSPLVWSPYAVPERPTWLDDVGPIFQQYANLYPVMKPIVDLANFGSLVEKLGILKNVFKAPVSDPNYMPVTRDLSGPKREMLLRWLKRPRYMRNDSKEDLLRALQQAVELEHATIPLYLTALYSIRPGANVEVAALIKSVVLEEMLHMALVSNLMISIGGAPSIDSPGFVPRYPGPLPGGLAADLTVRLRRCSINQIRDVFMAVEQPEETYEPVHGEVDPDDPEQASLFTIGWFYDRIERSLDRLAAQGEITFGNEDRQVAARIGPHRLYRINSLEDARRAIREIKEQGEGASPVDPAQVKGREDLAHYYKFAEIVNGHQIVIEKDGFSYTGPRVPFDPDGVFPMMDDPDTSTLPAGSRAQTLSRQFNATYQALLNALHGTFNGNPDHFSATLGLMYSLELQAQELMQTPSGRNDGTTAGPSFQLPFPL